MPTSNPEYQLFRAEGEYQLMVFPAEDLLGVYSDGGGNVIQRAMKDVADDLDERGARNAVVHIDLD